MYLWFLIVSKLLWEIVILYFEKQELFLKNCFGVWRICSCQCNWRLGYCKVSGSYQEQSPYGFYWQDCENSLDWQFLRLWYGWFLSFEATIIQPTFDHFLHTLHRYSLIGWMCDKNTNKPEIKTFVSLSINFHN